MQVLCTTAGLFATRSSSMRSLISFCVPLYCLLVKHGSLIGQLQLGSKIYGVIKILGIADRVFEHHVFKNTFENIDAAANNCMCLFELLLRAYQG